MSIHTAIILAAGYGNRIRDFSKLSREDRKRYHHYLETHKELLQTTPKPLLSVWGHPIVTLVVKKIEAETEVRNIYVVTNSDYYGHFQRWQRELQGELKSGLEVKVIDNGVRTGKDGQGWMRDLYHAIEQEKIDEDILTFYGDTIFGLDLRSFIDVYEQKRSNLLAVYRAPHYDLHRRGIVVVDEAMRVQRYLEKPRDPPSNLAGIMPYVLQRDTVRLLPRAFDQFYHPELNLMEWLTRTNLADVHAVEFADRIDIGTGPDLCEVNTREPLTGWRF